MKWTSGLGLCIACALELGCRSTATPLPDNNPGSAESSMVVPGTIASSGETPAGDSTETGGQPPAHYGAAYGLRPSYYDCMRNQPVEQSTAGHYQGCADEELEYQDTRLDAAWRNMLDGLRKHGQYEKALNFEDAQKKFEVRLNDACAAEAEKATSTRGPAALSTCLMERTARRAEELEAAYFRLEQMNDENNEGTQPSYGATQGLRPDYQWCMTHQPDDQTTAAHRQGCAEYEYEFQDDRLNRAYAAVMATLRAKSLDARARSLETAQRKWVAQLDETCTGEEGMATGMGPAVQTTCLMNKTAERAHALEKMRDDLGK